MAITPSKIYKYLGMTIDCSSPVKVKFSMVYHIGKMLDGISEDMRGGSSTPVAHHLFDIAEYAKKTIPN